MNIKFKIIGAIVGLVVAGLVGWIFIGGNVPELTGQGGELGLEFGEESIVPEQGADAESLETGPETEKTPIETAFEKAKDVEITGAKAKAVDDVLRPVLKGVFDTEKNEEIIVGVKMREEFGPMLTYAFNRKVTEMERDVILGALETAGITIIDRTEKVITVQQGSNMWVITFYLNSEQKSGLEITF